MKRYYGVRLPKGDDRIEKFKLQRKRRGFDDSETWNLDVTIAEFILPRLKVFKELNIAYPPSLTPEKWDEIIDTMIYSFEEIIKNDWSLDEEVNRKIKLGLDNFREYYFNLWW